MPTAAPDYPPRTWTVYFDYGNAPMVWQRAGHVVDRFLGENVLSAADMADIVPNPMGQTFDALGCAWESTDAENIDWLVFHQEMLRLTALLALWVAQFNIVVRYTPVWEDRRFDAHESETWMEPGTVARLARGMPAVQDDPQAWDALAALYATQPLHSTM